MNLCFLNESLSIKSGREEGEKRAREGGEGEVKEERRQDQWQDPFGVMRREVLGREDEERERDEEEGENGKSCPN